MLHAEVELFAALVSLNLYLLELTAARGSGERGGGQVIGALFLGVGVLGSAQLFGWPEAVHRALPTITACLTAVAFLANGDSGLHGPTKKASRRTLVVASSGLAVMGLGLFEVSAPWSRLGVVGLFTWALLARRPAQGLSPSAALACLVSAVLGLLSRGPHDALAVLSDLSKAAGFALIARDLVFPLAARPYEAARSAAVRHRMELAERALRYRQVFDGSPDAIMLCELVGERFRYVDVNPAFERLFGQLRAELLGTATDTSALSAFAESMAKCVRAGTTYHEEVERSLPQGVRFIRSTLAPLLEPGRDIHRLIGVFCDVTDQRSLERTLTENTLFTQTVILKAPVGLAVYRVDGSCALVNEAFAGMVGCGREQLEAERFAWKDPELRQLGESVLGTGRPRRDPVHVVTAFDKDLWAERQLARVSINGAPHLMVLLVDITEAHLAADALSSARQQLKRSMEATGLGVWVQDLSDGTLHWDEQMFELLEVPSTMRGSLLNLDTWRDRCHPDDLARATATLDEGTHSGTPFAFESRLLLPSGATRWLHSAGVLERDARGRPARLVGTSRDITVEREREAALDNARRQAEDARRAKDELLEHASSELRGPATVVAGLADVLLDTMLDAAQRRYLERIRLASRAALGMLSDLADFTRIEAGQLKLDLHDFSLEDVLRETATGCSPRAEEQGSELVFEVAPEAPTSLHGDAARVGQLLHNLVSHAVTHVGNGEVRVLVERAIAGSGIMVSVLGTVTDLPAEDVGRLLEPFRGGQPADLEAPGEGLGLALSHRLVCLMNGELVVESAPGGGCTFRVFLPIAVAEARSGTWRLDALEGMRALVVDDRESARCAVARLLEPMAVDVTLARSGATALRAVEEAARAGRPFEVLLIDCAMPGMDGLELARRARSLMGSWGSVSMVMMATSFGRERVLKAGSAEGIDAILEKPVLRTQLLETLLHLQQGRRLAS